MQSGMLGISAEVGEGDLLQVMLGRTNEKRVACRGRERKVERLGKANLSVTVGASPPRC